MDRYQSPDTNLPAEMDQPDATGSLRDDGVRQDDTGGLLDTTPADPDAGAEIDVARGTTGFQGAGSPAVENPS